jgi:hypothetical protein
VNCKMSPKRKTSHQQLATRVRHERSGALQRTP